MSSFTLPSSAKSAAGALVIGVHGIGDPKAESVKKALISQISSLRHPVPVDIHEFYWARIRRELDPHTTVSGLIEASEICPIHSDDTNHSQRLADVAIHTLHFMVLLTSLLGIWALAIALANIFVALNRTHFNWALDLLNVFSDFAYVFLPIREVSREWGAFLRVSAYWGLSLAIVAVTAATLHLVLGTFLTGLRRTILKLILPIVGFISVISSSGLAAVAVLSLLPPSAAFLLFMDFYIRPLSNFEAQQMGIDVQPDPNWHLTVHTLLWLGGLLGSVWLLALVLKPFFEIISDVFVYLGDPQRRVELIRTLNEGVSPERICSKDLFIIGHSLGSLIAVDSLLSNHAWSQAASVTLITMGSPIQRLVARFFSGIYPQPSTTETRLGGLFRKFRWINIFRPWDPIGSVIRGGHINNLSTCQFSRIGLRAHTDYWTDPIVLKVIDEATRCVDFISPEACGSDLSWPDGQQSSTFGLNARKVTCSAMWTVAVVLAPLAAFINLFFWTPASEARSRQELVAHLNQVGITTTGQFKTVIKEGYFGFTGMVSSKVTVEQDTVTFALPGHAMSEERLDKSTVDIERLRTLPKENRIRVIVNPRWPSELYLPDFPAHITLWDQVTSIMSRLGLVCVLGGLGSAIGYVAAMAVTIFFFDESPGNAHRGTRKAFTAGAALTDV